MIVEVGDESGGVLLLLFFIIVNIIYTLHIASVRNFDVDSIHGHVRLLWLRHQHFDISSEGLVKDVRFANHRLVLLEGQLVLLQAIVELVDEPREVPITRSRLLLLFLILLLFLFLILLLFLFLFVDGYLRLRWLRRRRFTSAFDLRRSRHYIDGNLHLRVRHLLIPGEIIRPLLRRLRIGIRLLHLGIRLLGLGLRLLLLLHLRRLLLRRLIERNNLSRGVLALAINTRVSLHNSHDLGHVFLVSVLIKNMLAVMRLFDGVMTLRVPTNSSENIRRINRKIGHANVVELQVPPLRYELCVEQLLPSVQRHLADNLMVDVLENVHDHVEVVPVSASDQIGRDASTVGLLAEAPVLLNAVEVWSPYRVIAPL